MASEHAGRPSLKPRDGPDVTIQTPTRRSLGEELSPGTGPVAAEGGKTRCKFTCRWNQADDEEEGEKRKVDGDSEPRDEESTEHKLYKIADELLQTERAYVARLHLLDRVSACLHLLMTSVERFFILTRCCCRCSAPGSPRRQPEAPSPRR